MMLSISLVVNGVEEQHYQSTHGKYTNPSPKCKIVQKHISIDSSSHAVRLNTPGAFALEFDQAMLGRLEQVSEDARAGWRRPSARGMLPASAALGLLMSLGQCMQLDECRAL